MNIQGAIVRDTFQRARGLPLRKRVVFLRDWAGLTFTEIGATIGYSKQHVANIYREEKTERVNTGARYAALQQLAADAQIPESAYPKGHRE